jgi:peptidylprolyl isomerase
MKKIGHFILIFGLFIGFSSWKRDGNKEKEVQTHILIHTDLGDIKILLYNETPKHRDNFIKLVKEGTLNGSLFHRVIEGFMIQGGDPGSKDAQPGVPLGQGNVGYTVPAEFNPKLIHKKGALAGAREGDEVNPKKESSGCQFYIVHGRLFNDTLLNMLEMRNKQVLMQQIFNEYVSKPENAAFRDKFIRLQNQQKMDSLQILSMSVEPYINAALAKNTSWKYTPEQRKIYSTIGGAPHLDGGYTVFGEVYEGLEVVDKIAAAEKDQYDRPKTDIHMTLTILDK